MQENNFNPYQAPESDVDLKENEVDTGYFFTVSTLKFTVMSFCTLGLYELYWFYKNWVHIKKQTGKSMMPFWRAFFAPLWAYSCFKYIKDSAAKNGVEESLSIVLLTIVYFIVQALWRLPDPYWLLSFFSFLFVLPANTVALSINKQLNPEFVNNSRFSAWNWVGVIFGGLLFLLSIIGTFLPEY